MTDAVICFIEREEEGGGGVGGEKELLFMSLDEKWGCNCTVRTADRRELQPLTSGQTGKTSSRREFHGLFCLFCHMWACGVCGVPLHSAFILLVVHLLGVFPCGIGIPRRQLPNGLKL